MDHNDKRSHSVPAGTFTDRNPPVPMDPAPTRVERVDTPPSGPSIHANTQPEIGLLDGDNEVREDTLPGFAMEPLIPRQRVRTLLGVPALGGSSSSDADPSAAYRLSDAARGHEQKISAAIAEVLDVLHQDAPASESSELDAGFDDGFDASTLVSTTRDAREERDEYDEETLEDGSQRLTFMELELVDAAEATPRTPPPPPPGTAPSLGAPTAAALEALPDDSLAGFGEASVPAVIDIAPPTPRHADLGQPIALQAVSSLDELGAELGQRDRLGHHDGATAELGSQDGRASAVSHADGARRRTGHRPVATSGGSGGSAQQLQLDGSARLGLLSVAAVMLLATGIWYGTGGTFRRASDIDAAAAVASVTSPRPTTPAAVPNVPAAPKPAPALKAADTTATTETSRAPATDPGRSRGLGAAEHASAKPSVSATSSPKPAAASTPKPAPAAPTSTATTPDATAPKAVAANRTNGRASQAPVQGPKPKPEAATPDVAATAQLPEQPSRSDVLNRLESVRSSVRACAAGRSGVADLDITIANTGLVMHVLVGGDFAGTTEGSCIARAVRGARFPTFKQDRFRLLFPYAI